MRTLRRKKFDTAIEQYEKVSKKNPKAVQPLMMTGILYDMQKQPQKANELLSESVGSQQELCACREQSRL